MGLLAVFVRTTRRTRLRRRPSTKASAGVSILTPALTHCALGQTDRGEGSSGFGKLSDGILNLGRVRPADPRSECGFARSEASLRPRFFLRPDYGRDVGRRFDPGLACLEMNVPALGIPSDLLTPGRTLRQASSALPCRPTSHCSRSGSSSPHGARGPRPRPPRRWRGR